MTIKGFYQANPFRFCLLFFLTLFTPMLTIANTLLTMFEITAVQQRRFQLFLWLVGLTFAVILLDYFLEGVKTYLYSAQEETYQVRLRQQMVRHFFWDDQAHAVAQVQNRLTNDLVQNQQNYLEAFLSLVAGISYLTVIVVSLLTIHWSLLVTVGIMTTVSLFLPKLVEKPMQKAMMQISQSNQTYLDALQKWLQGLAEIRRYLAGEKLFQVSRHASKQLEEANVKQTAVTQSLSMVNGLVSSVFGLILFLLAGFLVSQNLVLFGVIGIIGNFRYYLNAAISMITASRGQLVGAKPLNREIAQTSAEIADQKAVGVEAPTAMRAENLSLKFPNGETIAFPKIDVKSGEKILLTGDSGSGKSTLFKLILGQLQPNTGQVVFKNSAGKRVEPDLSKIGYVPQTPVLFPASIEDNMTMFNEKRQSRLAPLIQKVQFAADLAKFKDGIKEKVNLKPLNVSGGQRQKIVLIRALAHDSSLILIDEGTSAIDQTATMTILKEVTATSATVIFIAHNFNEKMRQLFDREIHLTKSVI